MNAEIVLTGTELLLGEIVDTNSVMMARMFRDIGLDLHYKTVVGDNEKRITEVLRLALTRADFVIVSGGLGPTVDDVTRQAAAAATDRTLIYSDELEAQIAARFAGFGRQMAENNKRQAWIPEGAIPVENPVGTAPCFIVEQEKGTIICLPGVPRELEYMMTHVVIPYLKQRLNEEQVIKVRILRTCAIGESDIDRRIDDLMRLNNPTVGLAAHPGQVDIRITAKAPTAQAAFDLIAPIEADIRGRLGDYIFGIDQETLVEVVGGLLKQRQLKLAVVDSLTEAVVAQQLREAGYGEQLHSETVVASLADALTAYGLSAMEDGEAAAIALAGQAGQSDTVGLSIVGPTTADADALVWLASSYNGQTETRRLRSVFADTSRQSWLIIQAFDLVRRWFI